MTRSGVQSVKKISFRDCSHCFRGAEKKKPPCLGHCLQIVREGLSLRNTLDRFGLLWSKVRALTAQRVVFAPCSRKTLPVFSFFFFFPSLFSFFLPAAFVWAKVCSLPNHYTSPSHNHNHFSLSSILLPHPVSLHSHLLSSFICFDSQFLLLRHLHPPTLNPPPPLTKKKKTTKLSSRWNIQEDVPATTVGPPVFLRLMFSCRWFIFIIAAPLPR